jgi:hypothetical protein
VTLTIAATGGRVVRQISAPGTSGTVHRVAWDLRHPAATGTGFITPGGIVGVGRGGRGGAGRGGAGRGAGTGGRGAIAALPRDIGERGAFVSPGIYTVTLQAGDVRVSETLRVRGDPRLPLTIAEHRDRESFLLDLGEMLRDIVSISQTLSTIRRDLSAQRDAAEPGSPAHAAAIRGLEKLTEVESDFAGGPAAMRGRITGLLSAFNGSGVQQGTLYPPTPPQRAQAAEIRTSLGRVKRDLQALGRQP